MRFTIRRILVLLGLSLIIWFTYSVATERYDVHELYNKLILKNKFDEESFIKADTKMREDLHYSNYEYSGYQKFIKTAGVEKLKSMPIQERCDLFFNQFMKDNKDWSLQSFVSPAFDKDIVNKKGFFNKIGKRIKNAKPGKGKNYVITLQDNITIEQDYQSMVRRSKKIEQEMADTMTLFRLYGKCFIDNTNQKLNSIYNDLTGKFFSSFTSALPRYTFDLELLQENSIPIVNDLNYFEGQLKPFDSQDSNFIEFLHKNSNGKGILISANNRHERDITKLIRVLRALNNKLPIQIVHRNDLKKSAQNLINLVATTDVDHLLNPTSREYDIFKPELELLNHYKDYGSEFPKQQVFFVDISQSVTNAARREFAGYSNKILALMFCSFKEVIVLDADSVPLVPIEDFFNSAKYKLGGAYMFKDRSLRDYNDWVETNYFAKLMPSQKESIDSLFDMKVTEKTLGNNYMTGWRHFQEAGVVVIDKQKHFVGILASIFLLLWKDPVKSSVWGEKELYWLGMSMVGDEDYEFNEYAAGSVGKVSVDPKFKYYPNSDAHELCSSHPGHVDSDGKLLWVNSGFDYCKNNGHFQDLNRFPHQQIGSDEVARMYSNPLEVDSVVVPPDLPRFRDVGSPVILARENGLKIAWKKRKLDCDEIKDDTNQIFDYGPQKGWVKNAICRGYQYCAYDSIEGLESDGTSTMNKGKFFQFDAETIKNIEFISKVWFTGQKRLA